MFSKSILSKFIFSLIIFTMIPLLILGLVSYYVSANVLTQELNSSTGRALEKLSANIDLNVMQLIMQTDDLANDYNLNNELISIGAGKFNENISNQIYLRLQSSTAKVNYPVQVFVISSNGQLFSAQKMDPTRARQVKASIIQSLWYKNLFRFDSDLTYAGVLDNYDRINGSNKVCYLTRNIVNGDTYIGTIIIGVMDYTISKQMNNIKVENNSNVYLVDRDSNIVFKSDEAYAPKQFSDFKSLTRIAKGDSGSYSDQIDRRKYIINYYAMANFGWRIVEITPEESVYSRLYFIRNIMASLLTVSLVLIVVSLFVLKRSIVNPIIYLSRQMVLVKNGHMDVRIPNTRSDEIGVLNNGFNNMIAEIGRLIGRIKADEKTKRELEFQVLQAQIKPHFLYNVLNSIKLMAEMKGQRNIAKSVTSLVRMLEYNVDSQKALVRLNQEIDYLISYIYLSNLRHANNIKLVLDIEEGLQNKAILKLSLQPVVENSILHGFGPAQEKSTIVLSAHRNGEDMTISISDNGSGMEDSTLGSLLKGMERRHGRGSIGGIGLYNVNQRIKIEFGEKYGLSVISALGSGTIVSMLLPVVDEDMSEDDADETSNC